MLKRERDKRNWEIAYLYKSGQLSQLQLARRYHMSQPNVQHIIKKFDGVVLTGPHLPEHMCDEYGRNVNGRRNGVAVWPCRIEKSAHPVCAHGRDCHNARRCGASELGGVNGDI